MYEYKSTCEVQAGETFEAFHTRIIEASQKHLADYKTAKSACEDAKKAVEEKETECTTALKTYESQKTNCDSVQDAMDSYSCSYTEKATTECEAAQECYTKAVSNYDTVKASSHQQLDALKQDCFGMGEVGATPHSCLPCHHVFLLGVACSFAHGMHDQSL